MGRGVVGTLVSLSTTFVVGGLAGCLLFTERPQAQTKDAGDERDGSTSSSGTSGDPSPPVRDGAVCAITLPPANDCTGPGGLQTGRDELEPNDPTNPETVFVGENDQGQDTTTVICGDVGASDAQDSFTYKVDKNDCWEVTFESETAKVHVHGPGVDREKVGDAVIQFDTDASGKIAIDVSGTGSYVFSIR